MGRLGYTRNVRLSALSYALTSIHRMTPTRIFLHLPSHIHTIAVSLDLGSLAMLIT